MTAETDHRAKDTDVVLATEGVDLRFGGVVALDDVSCDIYDGELVSIIGPNGAGKTSLLNVFNGFYQPTTGSVYLRGEEITDMPSYKRAREGIARTFQSVELFEGEDVIGNLMTTKGIKNGSGVLSSLLFYSAARQNEVQNLREVEKIIDFLELWEHRNTNVETLPMGIQRRVGLGRAIAMDPEVILLDESMSGLSFDEKYDMVRFIKDLNEERGYTIVMIEHDLEVVTYISDRIIVLDNGSLIKEGHPDEVVNDPEVRRVYTG